MQNFNYILKTLAYSDIFDSPLNDREVWRYLISKTSLKLITVQEHLKIFADAGRIFVDGEFYFLKGRKMIVERRKERERWSKEKLKIAQIAADKLGRIPSIKMIGVTGALAMNNCREDDDIDLMIVTSVNTLWLTRLLITILCPILGIKRRRPQDQKINNKICLNLFLEEDHLKIEPENLFLAHEIVQIKPIFNRGGILEKFLNNNQWVEKFLPNVIQITRYRDNKITTNKKHLISLSLNIFISLLDSLAFYLQYQYMKPKITCEKVSLHQAFFHPNDLQNKIEKQYQMRLKQLGLDKR